MRLDSRKQVPLMIALCLITVFILTGCWGSKEAADNTTQPQEGVVNQPLRVGDAEWTVLSAEKLPPNAIEGEQPTQGVFLHVQLKCKNLSQQSQDPPSVDVIDSQGNEGGNPTFGWSVTAPESWGSAIKGQSMLAGAEISGYYLFEVLPDASGFKVKVRGFGMDEQEGQLIKLPI